MDTRRSLEGSRCERQATSQTQSRSSSEETGADTAKCYDCMGLCYASAGNIDDAPEAEAAACFARAIEMFDLAILRRCETTIFLPSIS